MDKNLDDFNRIMSDYDNPEKKGFYVFSIARELREAYPNCGSIYDDCIEYEITAFLFSGNYPQNNNPWGEYYYGPMSIFPNDDRTCSITPDINVLTPEMLDYWENRLAVTKNPLIAVRYGGLLYDFYKKINSKNPPYQTVEKYLESVIIVAEGNHDSSQSTTFSRLERALSIAISYRKPGLVNKIKNAIISFEDNYGEDRHPGTWGHSIKLLVGNPKVELTFEEEKDIVLKLTKRLERQSRLYPSDEEFSPYSVEHAANLLAGYYNGQKQKNEECIRRVFEFYDSAINKIIALDSPIISENHLTQEADFCKRFNLKEERSAILAHIQEIDKSIPNTMKAIPVEFKVTEDELNQLYEDIVKGDAEDVFARIALWFIPTYKEAEEQVLENSKGSISSLIPLKLLDNEGRILANIGSVENNLNNRTLNYISEKLRFTSVFLDLIFERAIEKNIIDEKKVIAYLQKTPIIMKDHFGLIASALKHYFSGEYAEFIHMAIPQIEAALRNVIELAGETTYIANGEGGYDVFPLSKILATPLVININENMITYFKVIFDSRMGLNLRNDMSHGILPEKSFNRQKANMVLHALLCLGMMRYSDEKE